VGGTVISAPRPYPREDSAGYKLLSLFLGLVVCVMGFFGLWLALSAQRSQAGPMRLRASPALRPRTRTRWR
jgi:hypothetical protein